MPHPQRCGVCYTALVGVPLPSFFRVSKTEKEGEVRGFRRLLLQWLGCGRIAGAFPLGVIAGHERASLETAYAVLVGKAARSRQVYRDCLCRSTFAGGRVGTKIAVYTAIFGGYDGVLEIERPDPDISYFLFTDGSIDAAPHPWQLRPMPAIFSDPQRDARRVKVLPHLFLPLQFEISVWIDGNCQIKNLSANAISRWIGDQDIALPGHVERNCVYKEAEVLIASGLFDSPARISRQMSAYRIYGMPQDFGLHHTNFLIRRHNNPDCLLFCSEWWQHISAHSKRDQLSFDFVRWKLPRSKVGTLDISYNDNSAFRCSGVHRSPRRIVSDHLGSTVRCNDLPHPFLAASYNPQYDVWPAQFLDHLRHLNEIASGTGEPLEGNLCYFHCQQDFKYSPPDPRRGERRETFLRALAGRSRLLEIGFNAGHSTLLALTHSNASVTSVDNCSHAYTEPTAAHLQDAFPGRLRFFPLDFAENAGHFTRIGFGHT